MRVYRGVISPWRRLARWVLTGDGALPPERETGASPSGQNETFLASLDEARQRAVLSALVMPRRPVGPDRPS